MFALQQTSEAGVRYGYMNRNPATLAGKNPQPAPRGVRVLSADELKRITDELRPRDAAPVEFAAAAALRPSEWASVERCDIDKARRLLQVRGTMTLRSSRRYHSRQLHGRRWRQSCRGSTLPMFSLLRGKARSMFTTSEGGSGGQPLKQRAPDTGTGTATCAAHFASNWLARGVRTFELGRIMGTSVAMIEAHYGALIDTANDSILARVEGFGMGVRARAGHARTSPGNGLKWKRAKGLEPSTYGLGSRRSTN